MVGPLLSLDGHRAAIVIGNEDEVRGALCCPVQDMRHWLCREFLNFGDAKSSQYSPHNFPLGGCLQITTMMICHGHLLAALAIVLSIERSAAAGSHSSWRRPSCNLFGKNSLLADNTRCASSITRDALSLPLQLRGGSTKADDADINDDDEDEEERHDPKSCLYSFDAEPNTKVVAPLGTDQWISLSALNRLRRTDPTKVEPMWHSRYSILKSWFSDESEFSMLQHVGVKGFLVSSVLLDGGNGLVLRSLLIMTVLTVIITLMPLLEFIVGRIIVSAPFWAQWTTWGRIVRAGFPLKLLLGQLAWKGVATAFSKLESNVREYIVDMECEILEESVPLTVGVDSIDEADGESDVEEVVDNLDGEDFDSYDDYDDEDDY